MTCFVFGEYGNHLLFSGAKYDKNYKIKRDTNIKINLKLSLKISPIHIFLKLLENMNHFIWINKYF